MKTQEDIQEIRDYPMTNSIGVPIRMATYVKFTDGQIITFTEKMNKAQAKKNAIYQANKTR